MVTMRLVCLVAAGGLLMTGCVPARRAPAGKALTLARDGRSDYSIVVANDASPSTRYGAEELQRFLREMTGAELPILTDDAPMGAHEILLGDSAHLRRLGLALDLEALGHEGYVIQTAGAHLVIAGGALRGNLYGVYGLLEDHLGCRWFTPEISRIPKRARLTLPPLRDRQIPVLEYREPFVIDCFDGDWTARNRMNSSAASLEERHGGKVRFGAGMFVHTFNTLIPPDKYFDTHPEYFSEIRGERVKDHSQLCCTHPDVERICIEEMRKHMQADPDAFVFSLSQNDWANYCECAECRKVAEAEESQMGPLLQLVNRVAEALEPEFPDKAIETLAYQYTRKPPKTMRPRHNVIIRLCSIECCFMHPLETCDFAENRKFREDVEGWARIADRLWVWDYVTSFRHFLVPFPNLRVLDDNIRFFIRHNVRGIFEQDNYRSLNGELSPLGGYMMAKFLWNPDYDEDTAMNEFLDAVYEDAAKPIRRYIDLLHDRVEKKNLHANIWIGPVEAPYLDDEIMARAGELWDRAERAVAAKPEVLERVRVARLSYEYAWIERTRHDGGRVYATDHAGFTITPDPAYAARVRAFLDVARRAQVTWIDEWRLTLDAYGETFQELFSAQPRTFAPREPVAVAAGAEGLDYAYYEGEWTELPDFDALQPAATGAAVKVDTDATPREEYFGLRYRGYFRAPQDGIYTFTLASNDGSRLSLGDGVLIDNDGLHSIEQRSEAVGLKAGLHPILIEFFQAGGVRHLSVHVEGPGVPRRSLSAADLRRAGP